MLACKPIGYALLFLTLTGCISENLVSPPAPKEKGAGRYDGDILFFSDTLFNMPQKGILQESFEGKQLFTASVKNGKLNGPWQSWYPGGALCDSGSFVNNLPDGTWQYRDSEGNLLALRQYSADKYMRVKEEMTRYHPKLNFFYLSKMYQQNKTGALHYLSSVSSFPGGAISKTKKLNLKQTVQYNISGSAGYTPVFSNCLHEGLYMNFFTTGHVQDSGYYKDGLRTGKWVHYQSPKGNSYQGQYHHGFRVKDWKVYNAGHRLTELIHYDNTGAIQWRKKMNR
jgi:antitoxin component YwqK of YwqJK toxin-antitoxin module